MLCVALWSVLSAAASSAGPGTTDVPPPATSVRTADVREPLSPAVDAAADEFGVPRDVLAALVWEASRFDPDVASAWAGHGPLDLRDDQDPSIESAAQLLGLSPDDLARDPRENVRGGAALLADQARRGNGGVLPDRDDLESWWPAIAVFSGSHDPRVQYMFASYVYELVYIGVDEIAPTREHVRFGGVPVDLPSLREGEPRWRSWVDYAGAYQYVDACDYSDYSRTGADIEYVVIHTVQGSYSGCISWFQNCSSDVSAHYVVRSSDGQITQMVHEEDVAWHAGNWTYNLASIGIEHEGYVDDPGTWYTDAMYTESAKLTADIVARTDVEADRSSIIGHYEVPGATHTDPGSGWDWDEYMALVTGSYTVAGDLTGVVADSDIYSGARIAGATVWIAETGETQTTSDTGVYLFQDLPNGTYTVHATAPGYAEGTCAKTVSDSSTYWCSIALLPAPDDTGSDDTDTGTDDDTDTAAGDTDDTGGLPDGGGPGDRLASSDVDAGCAGCNGAPGGALAWWLPLVLGVRRRR